MTRMVPRPDWTPEELLQTLSLVAQAEVQYREAMVREAEFGSDGVDWGPVQSLLARREKAVFALFHPAEEPAPVAPPPAEEPADRVAALDELAKELASMQAGTDLTNYWERWSKALTALRSELAASQREYRELKSALLSPGFVADHRCAVEIAGRYRDRATKVIPLGSSAPSGENRSEG